MMKNSIFNTKVFLVAAIMVLLGTSCSEDFFNKPAGDRITPDQHFKDLIDGQASVLGAIISLQEAMPRLIMLDGLRSDALTVTENADLYLRELNEHIYTDFNPYTSTEDFYKVIINLNEVLAYLDELAENERELDDYTTYYYRGAILAMRAWVYFNIARIHGVVTYLPDNMESLPGELLESWPKETIIDTLINQVLPYIYDPTSGQEKEEIGIDYYVNPKGILGEMYLEIGDYENAIKYLKMACESFGNTTQFKVDNTYKNEGWINMFLNAESATPEHMAVMPFTSTEGQNNPLGRWMGRDYDYLVKPTQILVDSFNAQLKPNGSAGDEFRGLDLSFGVDTVSKTSETNFVTENYVTKYEVDKGDPFSTDIIIQRAADLHLLLAEAYNRSGLEEGEHRALMFLNFGVSGERSKPPEFIKWNRNVGIRGRVGLEEKVVPDGLTGEDRVRYIEDLIMQERALELAFEGKRWFDLVRVADRRDDAAYLADRVAEKFRGTPQYNTIHDLLLIKENWYIPPK